MNEQQAAEGLLRDLLGRVGLAVERVVVSGDEVAVFARGRLAPGRPPSHRGTGDDVAASPMAGDGTAVRGGFDRPVPDIPTRLEVRLEGSELEGGIRQLPGEPRFDIAAMARAFPSVPPPPPGAFLPGTLPVPVDPGARSLQGFGALEPVVAEEALRRLRAEHPELVERLTPARNVPRTG